MLFIVLIVLLIGFHGKSANISPGELWFMLSIFVGLAYIAGFLDSRIFARLDKKKANMLAEAEERYERNIDNPSSPD